MNMIHATALSAPPGSMSSAPAGGSARPGLEKPAGAAEQSPLRPDRDEYRPGEPQPPTGRYWPQKDAEGRRVIRTDGQLPAGSDPAGDKEAQPEKEAEPSGKAPQPAKEERCTVSTDKVDREIRKLREEKARLERQLRQDQLPQKEEQLNQRLRQVEEQLRLKDNDAYRRQQAEYSVS